MKFTLVAWLIVGCLEVLRFGAPWGFVVGASILGMGRDSEDALRPWCFRIALLGALPRLGYVAAAQLSTLFSSEAIWSGDRYAVVWGVSVAGGIGMAFLLRRIGAAWLDRVKDSLTMPTALERNRKTDVREIGRILPRGIEFDPAKHFQRDRILLGLDEGRRPVFLDGIDGPSIPHVEVVGTTGAGKGVALGLLASQFLARGEAVFFMDPKNDEWAPHVLYSEARRVGTAFRFINPCVPHGPQINPFAGASREEIHEALIAGLGLSEKGASSDYYSIADRQAAWETAGRMAAEKLTAAEVWAADGEVLSEDAPKFAGKLRELAQTPSINAKEHGSDLAAVVASGGAVYVVGSMRHDTIKTIQRVLLVRLIQIAESRDRINGRPRPVCIVLDEVKYHLSRPALEGLGAARDKGVHLVLAHQSLGDLRDCPADLDADAVVDSVVENCKIKLCYQVQNPDTADWLARMSGTILVDDESRRVRKNIALSETLDGERTLRQAERPLMDTNMLRNLPAGVAVLFGQGLPRFVSIRPLRVTKSREAITVCALSVESPKSILSLDPGEGA